MQHPKLHMHRAFSNLRSDSDKNWGCCLERAIVCCRGKAGDRRVPDKMLKKSGHRGTSPDGYCATRRCSSPARQQLQGVHGPSKLGKDIKTGVLLPVRRALIVGQILQLQKLGCHAQVL